MSFRVKGCFSRNYFLLPYSSNHMWSPFKVNNKHVSDSPRPPLDARPDLITGPSCLGSPAKTTWPPLFMFLFRSPANGMTVSGSVAWPASSMKMWVKWFFMSADTSLQVRPWLQVYFTEHRTFTMYIKLSFLHTVKEIYKLCKT